MHNIEDSFPDGLDIVKSHPGCRLEGLLAHKRWELLPRAQKKAVDRTTTLIAYRAGSSEHSLTIDANLRYPVL